MLAINTFIKTIIVCLSKWFTFVIVDLRMKIHMLGQLQKMEVKGLKLVYNYFTIEELFD